MKIIYNFCRKFPSRKRIISNLYSDLKGEVDLKSGLEKIKMAH